MESDIISFGKYKGKYVSEILEINPKYLLWATSKNLITVDKGCIKMALISYQEESLLAEMCQHDCENFGDR